MYELAELRDQLADSAIEIAANVKVRKLDYSVKSVKRAEKALGHLHSDYVATGSDEGLNGIALCFAAYLIKVIESNFEAGEWSRDHSEMGEDSFPYRWRGGDLFPFAWCQKRIFDGPEDDVWIKFELLVVRDAG